MATNDWNFSFSGTVAEVKAALEAWAKQEYEKIAADVKPAVDRAGQIVGDFLDSVAKDAQVAISAANSDLEGAGFNVKLATVNHPVAEDAPKPAASNGGAAPAGARVKLGG